MSDEDIGHWPDDDGGRGRLAIFSDAVFAIALTLLALEIHPPDVAVHELPRALYEEWLEEVVTYFVAFFAVGCFFYLHHTLFRYIRRIDTPLVVLNLVFLSFIALLPATSDLFDRFPTAPVAVTVYALNITIGGLGLWLIWWYATGRGRLAVPALSPQLVDFFGRRCFYLPLAFVVAAPAALVAPRLTPLVWVAGVLVIEYATRHRVLRPRHAPPVQDLAETSGPAAATIKRDALP